MQQTCSTVQKLKESKMPFFKRNVNIRRSSNETDNKSADDALLDYDDVHSSAGGGGDGTLVTVRDDDNDNDDDDDDDHDKSFAKRSFFRFAARRSGQAKQSSDVASSSVSSRSDLQNDLNSGKSHDEENGKYAYDSASDDDDDDDGNHSGNYPCVHLSPPPPSSSASRKNSLFSVENSIAELAAFQIGDDRRDHLMNDDDASLAPSIDKYGFVHEGDEGGPGSSSAPRDIDVDDALDRGSVLTSNSSLRDAASSSAVSHATGATFGHASRASRSGMRSRRHRHHHHAPAASASAVETSHLLLRTKVTGVPKRRRNKNFARQGIKDEARRRAWLAIPNVDEVVATRKGEYDRLVERAAAEILELTSRRREGGRDDVGGTDDPLKNGRRRSALDEDPGRKGHSLDWWDTLERDLGRTFPKHLLFRHLKDFQGVGDTVRPDGSRAILFKGDNARMFGANGDDANDDFNDSDRSRLTDTSIAIPKPFEQQQQQQQQQQDENVNDNDDNNDDDDNSDAFEQVAKFAVQSTGQAALRRLLRAYSTHDPQVGYCQGMNFIAALFLMVMDDEETAFWMFVAVMNEDVYNLRELFVRDMAGTQEVLYVAERLIEQFLPRLFDHFQEQNVQMSMILTPWLMTIYTRNFPFELVLRVWDSFLVEGWKVVYRTMLALLEHAQPALLQLEFEEIIMYLREFTSTVDGPNIMMASLKISLRKKHILKYVAEWKGLSEKGETRKVDTGVFNRLNTRGSEVVSSMGFGSFVDT